MTTYILPSAIYGEPKSHGRSRRRQLLDRFWEAVHLDSPEIPSNDDVFVYSKTNRFDDPSTPEIFARFGSTPMIDVRSALNIQTPLRQPAAYIPLAIIVQPLHPSSTALTGRSTEHTKHNSRNRNRSKRKARPPKLSIPQDLKVWQLGITNPATAMLAMASNFLDDMVKLTRSQSPHSNTTFYGSPEGDVEVKDSEVHVNVIDDGKRGGTMVTSELPDESLL